MSNQVWIFWANVLDQIKKVNFLDLKTSWLLSCQEADRIAIRDAQHKSAIMKTLEVLLVVCHGLHSKCRLKHSEVEKNMFLAWMQNDLCGGTTVHIHTYKLSLYFPFF